MTTLILHIEKDTPEIKKVVEYLKTLAGVTITPEKSAKAENDASWSKALADGAVSLEEFHARFEEEIKNNW